jgi:hypothetical protein
VQRRARIKVQGRAITPAAVRVTVMGGMSGINAAIDVGKHQLEVALGSNGGAVCRVRPAPRNCAPGKLAQLGCGC